MITKFDSLYAGHVDLDDIGYGGADIVTCKLSTIIEHLNPATCPSAATRTICPTPK